MNHQVCQALGCLIGSHDLCRPRRGRRSQKHLILRYLQLQSVLEHEKISQQTLANPERLDAQGSNNKGRLQNDEPQRTKESGTLDEEPTEMTFGKGTGCKKGRGGKIQLLESDKENKNENENEPNGRIQWLEISFEHKNEPNGRIQSLDRESGNKSDPDAVPSEQANRATQSALPDH